MEIINTNEKAIRRREIQKIYYEANKEAIKVKRKEYYNNNKEIIIKNVIDRDMANPQQKKDQTKKRYDANKAAFIETAKARYQKYKVQILKTRKEKYEAHKQHLTII